jgi:hypothetical protein
LAIQSNNNRVLKRSEPSDHETFNAWNLPKITVPLEEGIAGGGVFHASLPPFAVLETGTVQPVFYLLYLLEEDFFFK